MKSFKFLSSLLLSVAITVSAFAQTVTVQSDNTWTTYASGNSTAPSSSWNLPSFVVPVGAPWGTSVLSGWNGCPGSPTPTCVSCTTGGSPLMWYTAATAGSTTNLTPIPANANSNYPVYFIHHFTLSTASISNITMNLLVDDGAEVYINGHSCGTASTSTGFSTGTLTAAQITAIEGYLTCGDNVVAIRAWNGNGSGGVTSGQQNQCWWVNFGMTVTASTCAPGLLCATPNFVPKINSANTNDLTCSQIYDDGTTINIGSTNTPYYVNFSSGSVSDSKLIVEMTHQSSAAGLMIKGGYDVSTNPTLGYSLVNSNNNTVLGASITGNITNDTWFTEGMDMIFSTKQSSPANTPLAERMRILSTGSIGVGTSTPTTKFHMNGQSLWLTGGDGGGFSPASAESGLREYYDNTNDYGVIFSYKYGTGSGTKNLQIQPVSGGNLAVGNSTSFTYTGLPTYNGGASPAPSGGTVKLDVSGVTRATAYYATSDANMKTNIKPIIGALDKVMALRGVSYNWNAIAIKEGGADNGGQLGFLAQEVGKILPEAVIKDDNGKYAMNYNMVIPVLVEAIKEMKGKTQENDDLKTALDNTNAKVNALQNQLNDICNSGCAGLRSGGTDANSSTGNVLMQNVPNPFSGQTTIGYVLNTGTTAYMNINGLDGKQIKRMDLTVKGQGSVTIDASALSAGTYTYSLYVDDKVIDTKLMVISAGK